MLQTAMICILCLWVVATPTTALAQSGKKIVRDTIYALAVDSIRYPDESFVYLLDDGVLRFEPTGAGSKTYRQVVQVLKEDAVEQWAEYSISYSPDRERLTVNWARVVLPDGTVLAGSPEVSQESDLPAAMGSPVYQRVKVRRFSLGQVAPGTLVDVSYTIETTKPFLKGDFYTGWTITTGRPVMRSRLVLDTPIGYEPRIEERNLSFAVAIEDKGGRRVRTWATGDLPRIDPEPFASDSNGVYQGIQIAGRVSWDSIGAWYAGLARDRYAMTPALAAKLEQLVAGATTLDDSLRAVHRFVARDVRYLAVSLGMGGYQPRLASEVLASGLGDCKDKATLFVTLARAMGLAAFPMLINSEAEVDADLPTISQFDHAIAVLEREGQRTFVDLTASDTPFGLVPSNLEGQFGLVVHPGGETVPTVVPEPDSSVVGTRILVRGEVDSAGFFAGTVEMAFGGSTATTLRAALAEPLDSLMRRSYAKSMAGPVYPGVEADSLEIVDTGATGGSPTLRAIVRQGRAARLAGSSAVLTMPFRTQEPDFSETVRELKKRTPRRFPISIPAVVGIGTRDVTFELTLPPGWTVELPSGEALEGWWGRFETSIRQDGRSLTLTERMRPARGNLAPERVDDAVSWFLKAQDLNRNYGSVVVTRR